MTLPVDIVLASASPRRRELLERIGVRFTVVPSHAPEEEIAGESPEQHVLRLSRDKAFEVAKQSDIAGRWFIGSDTIVLRDETILGKPASTEDAAVMLRSLSGREHRVLSGFAVHDRHTGLTEAEAVSTRVRFKELTEDEIAGYIATGEPMDKAGSYAIQGIGVFMVLAIEGSYTNVVGLPLCEVIAVLERLGAITLFEQPL